MFAVKWLDFPLNHNKQKCKMCPNDNHERVRGLNSVAEDLRCVGHGGLGSLEILQVPH